MFHKSHGISKICSNLCLYSKKTKGIHFKRKLRLQTSWRYANLQCQIFSKLFGLVKIRIKIQDSWVAWSIYAFWVVELWLKMRTLFGKKWNTLVVKILGDFILSLFFPLTNLVMNLPFSLYNLYMLANLHFLWNLWTIIFLSFCFDLPLPSWSGWTILFFSSDLALVWNGWIFSFPPSTLPFILNGWTIFFFFSSSNLLL